MRHKVFYAPVSEAIEKLREQGYTSDFSIQENNLLCEGEKYNPSAFEIGDIYRYEGDSDPGDEAVVYAIESTTGKKGVLVTGYGLSSDEVSPELLKKFTF